jgi:hypothetical protein
VDLTCHLISGMEPCLGIFFQHPVCRTLFCKSKWQTASISVAIIYRARGILQLGQEILHSIWWAFNQATWHCCKVPSHHSSRIAQEIMTFGLPSECVSSLTFGERIKCWTITWCIFSIQEASFKVKGAKGRRMSRDCMKEHFIRELFVPVSIWFATSIHQL